MEWEQWFCPERSCATEAWLVQQAHGHAEIWSLRCRLSGAAFTVAASNPVWFLPKAPPRGVPADRKRWLPA